jgi:hypothetical protein
MSDDHKPKSESFAQPDRHISSDIECMFSLMIGPVKTLLIKSLCRGVTATPPTKCTSRVSLRAARAHVRCFGAHLVADLDLNLFGHGTEMTVLNSKHVLYCDREIPYGVPNCFGLASLS